MNFRKDRRMRSNQKQPDYRFLYYWCLEYIGEAKHSVRTGFCLSHEESQYSTQYTWIQYITNSTHLEMPGHNLFDKCPFLIVQGRITVDELCHRAKNLPNYIVTWVSIKAQYDKVKCASHGLISRNAIEREVFVIDRICRLTYYTSLHLFNEK